MVERRSTITVVDLLGNRVNILVHPISRPGECQQLMYNGQKHVHGLKLQSVVVSKGLIAHLYGPVGKSLSTQFQVARASKIHNVLLSL